MHSAHAENYLTELSITYDNKRKKNNTLAFIWTTIKLENFVDSCVTPEFNHTLAIHVFLTTF